VMSALGLANEEAALEFIRPTVREVWWILPDKSGCKPSTEFGSILIARMLSRDYDLIALCTGWPFKTCGKIA
ncbi:hypothetical protein ACFLXE_08250, partial [Chloroflexota bacterium]